MMAKSNNQPVEIHLLIPARTDTEYFHEYIKWFADIHFIRGRLKFVDLTGVSKKPTSAPFPSIVCIYKHAWAFLFQQQGVQRDVDIPHGVYNPLLGARYQHVLGLFLTGVNESWFARKKQV